MGIACITKHELVRGESKNGLVLSIIQGPLGILTTLPLMHHRVQVLGEENLSKHLCI